MIASGSPSAVYGHFPRLPGNGGVLDKVQDILANRANTVPVCVHTSSLLLGACETQALGVYHTYSGIWIEE